MTLTHDLSENRIEMILTVWMERGNEINGQGLVDGVGDKSRTVDGVANKWKWVPFPLKPCYTRYPASVAAYPPPPCVVDRWSGCGKTVVPS